jgi:hypothetical protein
VGVEQERVASQHRQQHPGLHREDKEQEGRVRVHAADEGYVGREGSLHAHLGHDVGRGWLEGRRAEACKEAAEAIEQPDVLGSPRVLDGSSHDTDHEHVDHCMAGSILRLNMPVCEKAWVSSVWILPDCMLYRSHEKCFTMNS